jgi:ring-1,2-phenylacetyl-CoA epoxidase subunit PaaE
MALLQHLHKIHTITVKRTVMETADAISVYFNTADLTDSFRYIQGQYVILHFDIDGKHYSRAYSLFTAPFETDIAITVKRIKGDIVSNFIYDNIKESSVLQINFPRGNFNTKLSPKNNKNYYFFGSGITPLLSNIKMILKTEPLSTIYFLYGNRDKKSIIHFKDLEELKKQYPNRLFIQYEFESENDGFSRTKFGNILSLKTGLIDKKCVLFFLNKYLAEKESEYFICGPAVLMDNVEQVLHSIDVDKKKIHIERFGSNSNKFITTDTDFNEKVELTYTKEGEKKSIVADGNKSLFQSLTEAGENIDHSCLAGSCASCVCTIYEGNVEMKDCYALNTTQLKDNFILTCQSYPLTNRVAINFDLI